MSISTSRTNVMSGKTKFFTCILLLILLCINFATDTVYAEEGISVIIDGTILEFDVPPIIINGRTMVPMRAIFEALGADVSWNSEKGSAIGVKDGIEITITIGESKMFKNNLAYNLDSAAIILNGRTLMPVRAIAESFDCVVTWNGNTRTVYIVSQSKEDFSSVIDEEKELPSFPERLEDLSDYIPDNNLDGEKR